VIERAGLGRATLYRHFPDRTALMMALLDRAIDAFESAAAELGERPDGLACCCTMPPNTSPTRRLWWITGG
jgi:AcrR family transcriptional regulator